MADNAAERVAERLRLIRDRAASDGPRAAVQALTQAGETITKLTLSRSTHPPGTRTPSAPGQPPALVTGNLRRSVQRPPAWPSGTAAWSQAITCLLLYGAVQEHGAVIRVQRARVLANRSTGQFFGQQVTLPPRPWFEPSMRILITSGAGADASVKAFLAVVYAGF